MSFKHVRLDFPIQGHSTSVRFTHRSGDLGYTEAFFSPLRLANVKTFVNAFVTMAKAAGMKSGYVYTIYAGSRYRETDGYYQGIGVVITNTKLGALIGFDVKDTPAPLTRAERIAMENNIAGVKRILAKKKYAKFQKDLAKEKRVYESWADSFGKNWMRLKRDGAKGSSNFRVGRNRGEVKGKAPRRLGGERKGVA